MPVRIMSDTELSKFEVLRDVDHERMAPRDAAQVLGLSERQVWRLLRAYRANGADGLISKKRGRPSNRKTPEELRSATMTIIKDRYADFGPTFAAEKLREAHGVDISRETLRKWMIADGLWLDRKRRLKRAYQPRYRRDCVGELVQVDGSEHRWFEGRGPMCTLLVFVDDATSRLMQLSFAPSESTFSYFTATRAYLEAHGKPVAFYSDKHGVFRVNRPDAAEGDGLTQFGRALHGLNIDLICANSSQAKGRVERANQTLQDRFVKELRLAGIDTMAGGNAFAKTFMADHNARFAKAPASLKDLHRPLSARDNLAEAFTWRETRLVSKALTIQYDRTLFILEQTPAALAAAGKYIEVIEYPDRPVTLRHDAADLPYRTFDKERRVDQAAIVENKRLGPLLAMIREEQLLRDAQAKPRRSIRPVKRMLAG